MTDNYSLLMMRNELIKCRNCYVNSPCCVSHCEIFDGALKAKKAGVLEKDICCGCPQYNNQCSGYENSGYPIPLGGSHTTIESICHHKGSGEIITSSLQQSKSYAADEKWLITRGGEKLSGYKWVPELAPDEGLFSKYRNYWQDKPPSIWWNKYKSEFVKQFKKPQFIMKLALLYEKVHNQNQNIILVCFCENVEYCHRKLIAYFLTEKGLKVQVY